MSPDNQYQVPPWYGSAQPSLRPHPSQQEMISSCQWDDQQRLVPPSMPSPWPPNDPSYGYAYLESAPPQSSHPSDQASYSSQQATASSYQLPPWQSSQQAMQVQASPFGSSPLSQRPPQRSWQATSAECSSHSNTSSTAEPGALLSPDERARMISHLNNEIHTRGLSMTDALLGIPQFEPKRYETPTDNPTLRGPTLQSLDFGEPEKSRNTRTKRSSRLRQVEYVSEPEDELQGTRGV